MNKIFALKELREELSFKLIESEGKEYKKILEKIKDIENKIEEYEEYKYFLEGFSNEE